MTRRYHDTDGVLPETWEFDANGDLSSVKVSMDVESTVKAVDAKREATGGKGNFGWHIGTLPVPVILEYCKLRGIEPTDFLYNPAYGDEVVALCQHRDYRIFSPTSGKA